ncbi:hypothetical protein MPC4_150104 [Methylocella tundrae]|uniref:DUF2285 domain-containing protein n=1 Tax=Methylocella tundrae TaxID=227605 RepID=A0A8B6M5H1_METTU|nr:hypothetical protein MPC1_1560001 [Methylocella tundrae]VTZ49322.1 hypothetical protein MPC4_150104 [Methylocella tundrae]
MTEAPFQDRPPHTDRVNAYDEQHLAVYLRLLMAEEEGADWREVVQGDLRPQSGPGARPCQNGS